MKVSSAHIEIIKGTLFLTCRLYLQAKYFKIYIDEYQDCDKSMHKFFMYLCDELNIETFVVGDEKQSIYIWRGAYPEAFKSIWNKPNFKKIFMGDTGSLTLGYILAFLAIAYTNNNSERAPYTEGAIVVAFSTLIVPMFDVFRVILVRARNHKGLFNADRNHIHHKFLDMGFSPRKAMISILAMALSFSVINMTLISYVNNNVLFIMDIVVWVGLNVWFDRIRDKNNLSGKLKDKI